jgi:cytosine/adenosine deaminase-related metal-dependent hydrolase/ubiquinone/menaquinone biosynthesis C-methylase UbiE
MASPSPPSSLGLSDGFRLWARSYDAEANPMLSLERRVLEPLLPLMDGLNVLDLGCGTGRWLQIAKAAGARRLVGIDLSPEMLSQAREKLGEAATLHCSDYVSAPVQRASSDVALCNFVLSYLDDLCDFARHVKKILRDGGSLFVTDVHPETARVLNWRRGARDGREFQEILTSERPLPEVIAAFRDAGFAIRVHLEPKFGPAEQAIFEQNGKGDYFEEIREYPAIYLLQLAIPEKPKRTSSRKSASGLVTGVRRGRFALGPADTFRGAIQFNGSHVECIRDVGSAHSSRAIDHCVDLSGYLALPGLINAHDHLEFALFPRLGRGNYQNFVEWAEEIHRVHANEIARHREVPKRVRLWWGGIRNVLCGVTTVCHHNPYEPEVFSSNFVVRVLKDYGWAHSLRMDPDAVLKRTRTPEGQRFFLHLAEGIDEQSEKELFELARAGALDVHTVVIHGLGMSPQGRATLRESGAGLVWCPSSNQFLFGRSLSFPEVRQFPKLALGSDSPLTADGDLLDEVRCAHLTLQAPANDLYGYVMRAAAQILGVRNGEGTLRAGGFADLIAVPDRGLSPADTLAALSYRDVELVILAGQVQLASPEIKDRLPHDAAERLQALSVDGVKRWIRAPIDELLEETHKHLHGDIYLGGKRVELAS